MLATPKVLLKHKSKAKASDWFLAGWSLIIDMRNKFCLQDFLF